MLEPSLSNLAKEGAAVPGDLQLGKGSKRRLRQIRWKRSEIVSALLLVLAIGVFGVYLAWWLATHPFD